jgi:hypothetical protein
MYKVGEAPRGKPDDITTRLQMSAAEVVEKIKKYYYKMKEMPSRYTQSVDTLS